MMRLDEEDTFDINEVDSQLLLGHIDHLLSSGKIKVLIFEDYNKGLLSELLIQHVLELCKKYQVITTVDPKRKNFLSYKGVDVFKPNLKEVKDALGIWVDQVHLSALEEVHHQLKQHLHHSVSLITLSEKGVFCKNNHDAFIIPSYVRNIADVSGAGDTVIAVASLVYAITKDIKWMAEIANVAAGQVCEEVGTVAVDADRLLDELQNLYPNGLA
jgi:rfaE bifunctional protein kinase chain/domain